MYAFCPPIHNATHSTQQTTQHTKILHIARYTLTNKHTQYDTAQALPLHDATRTPTHTRTSFCPAVFMMIHDKLPIATGGECFKLLTNQLAMVGYWPVMAVTGNSELGFDCGEGAFCVVGAPSRRWRLSAAEDLLALVLFIPQLHSTQHRKTHQVSTH